MTPCESAQDKLAHVGREGLETDGELREHVHGCPHCTRFLNALETVDELLGTLSPHVAPASATESLNLYAATPRKSPNASAQRREGGFRAAGALACAATVLAAVGLASNVVRAPQLQMLTGNMPVIYSQPSTALESTVVGETIAGFDTSAFEQAISANAAPSIAPLLKGLGEDTATQRQAQEKQRALEEIAQQDSAAAVVDDNREVATVLLEEFSAREARTNEDTAVAAQSQFSDDGSETIGGYAFGDGMSLDAEASDELAGLQSETVPEQPKKQASLRIIANSLLRSNSTAGKRERVQLEAFAKDYDAPLMEGEATNMSATNDRKEQLETERLAELNLQLDDISVQYRADEPSGLGSRSGTTPAEESVSVNARVELKNITDKAKAPEPVTPESDEAFKSSHSSFLSARDELDGVDFQTASGYWANTYVPGTPVIRLLESQLVSWNREAIAPSVGTAPLESAVAQNWQPFDAPRDAAIATYLHADKASVNGRTRLKVQIGLKASEREGGHRPAVNLGVVLDLRAAIDTQTAVRIRALLEAINRARQPGDRFSLTVAGPDGGTLVEADEFRHGPLSVAMSRLFAREPTGTSSPRTLTQAFNDAISRVRETDDPGSTLGSSLVLFVSTQDIGAHLPQLEPVVHDAAVNGITVSTVALGKNVGVQALERLVLLGQGNRLALLQAKDAPTLVDRELHTSSRAVARALRIRLKLAPGVQLIEVLGAHRLDSADAERVREAENSLDQRLARNLGITADRGDDEEGIQIVIPNFYAGDTHVVLLDVVAERPGPIADLTVRYKDLVYLRNGINRARLSLPAGNRALGPLERNVIKNQLAHLFSMNIARAADELALNQRHEAENTLARLRALIQSVRREVPAWRNDVELHNDEQLLSRYVQLIKSNVLAVEPQRRNAAASMRVAAHARVVPPFERHSGR